MRVQFVTRKTKQKKPLLRRVSLKTLFQDPPPDLMFVTAVFSLVLVGLVMVYSSSALFADARYGDQYYFLKRQLMWSLIGLGGFFAALHTPLRFWQKFARPLYVLTLLLLGVVLFSGPEISGARRWIRFGGLSFQPSELAKIALIFMVADYMDRHQSRLWDFKKGLLPLLIIIGMAMVLILVEPDLGTPALMSAVLLSMMILGGVRWNHLFGLGAGALAIICVAIVQSPYRVKRVFAFLDPWADPQGTGYQLVQSLLALGSGGIIGRGLGNSKIKVSNLPDAHTDFVFSVLGEELGLIGTILCAALFLFVCIRGLQLAHKSNLWFAKLAGYGLSLMIGFQAVLNMGVACGLFPTKGIPLPFISFGGSSLLMTLFAAGLLANISCCNATPLSKGKT